MPHPAAPPALDPFAYHVYPVAYRVNATSKQRYVGAYNVELRRLTDPERHRLHSRHGGTAIGVYADRDGDVWDLDLTETSSYHARQAADDIAAYDPAEARRLRALAAGLEAHGL